LYKISSAVIVAVVSAAMGLFGYVESSGNSIIVQSAGAVLGIRLLMSCAPALCLILSVIYIKKLPSGKENFDNVKKSIAGIE
jgi:GPH family glycoside/pentoside/hexuronide:cation symporter